MRKRRQIILTLLEWEQAKMEREYKNLLLYGCSIAPEEFYGNGITEIMDNTED